MEFDKTKILTVVTADQLEEGQLGWINDTVGYLESDIQIISPYNVFRTNEDIVDFPFIAIGRGIRRYFYPAPTHAERQAEWVKENGVKQGTKIRITKDYGEDIEALTIGRTGVAGICGSVNYVGNGYINVDLDSEEFYLLTVPYYAMEVIKESKRTYKPITGFETGKWYVCHLTKRPHEWNIDGEMDGLLDGKPHKCTFGEGVYADFEDIPINGFGGWSFVAQLGYFEEVPSPGTSYSEKQAEWVKQNNIKGGTKVRFTKNFTNGEDGSGCCEHKYVKGMEGVVKYTEDDYLAVLVPYFGGVAVPFTALEVIKEPTYRPYNNDELNDLVGEVLTNKKSGIKKLVTGKPIASQGVNLDGSYISAKDLLSSFYRNTNEICGIKE